MSCLITYCKFLLCLETEDEFVAKYLKVENGTVPLPTTQQSSSNGAAAAGNELKTETSDATKFIKAGLILTLRA